MGAFPDDALTIREILPGDSQFLQALQLAVMARPRCGPSYEQPVLDLIEPSNGSSIVGPVVGAFAQQQLLFAAAGVEAGISNLLLIPFELSQSPMKVLASRTIRVALQLSRGHGVAFSQVIAPQCPSIWEAILLEAGFTYLTDLLYMDRPRNAPAPPDGRKPDATKWITYSDELASTFCEALEQSYQGSQDCPQLLDMRSARQSLETHRASGEFNPQAWFLLMSAAGPLGILLLSKVRREPLMEILYMGVSQSVRGKGVANLLMEKAVLTASTCAANLILAVDVRNEPAKRLYQRWNFQKSVQRSAWIANLLPIER